MKRSFGTRITKTRNAQTHQRGSRDELEERFSPMRGQWKLQRVLVYALAFSAADELRWVFNTHNKENKGDHL